MDKPEVKAGQLWKKRYTNTVFHTKQIGDKLLASRNDSSGYYDGVEPWSIWLPTHCDYIGEAEKHPNAKQENSMQIIWPEVFINPDNVDYDKDENGYALALADAGMGWANCVFDKPPETFGKGMAKISKKIGCVATPDEVKRLSKNWLENNRVKDAK